MKFWVCLASTLAFMAIFGSARKIAENPVVSYEGYKVFRVETPTKASYDTLAATSDISFWNEGRIGGHADVMVAPNHLKKSAEQFILKNLKYSVMVENVGDLIRLEQIPAHSDPKGPKMEHSMTWTEYHPKEDMESYLDYLASTYDFVTLETIGQSYEGTDMRVAKVCRGGCGGNKTAMWIDGGIHSREWISPATVTWMLKELVENDAAHPDLTEKMDWYILPVVNPDGYAYTRNGDRMWRKTRTPHGILGCKGTDANRNWGFHWNDGGSSSNSCSETYMGPEVWSEVENTNVRDFVSARKENIKFFNTIHSYSQLVLLPYGFSSDTSIVPGYDKLLDLATKSNEALYAVHQKRYDVGCIPCLLYVASGGSLDWALGEAGIPYSMAMELRDTGSYGFILPPSQIIPTGEEVWAFHLTAARMIIEEFGQ